MPIPLFLAPLLALLAFAVQGAAPLRAQVLPAGTRYDAAIPTLTTVVGHDFGEEVTPPEEVVRYMEALAAAAPTRTRLVRYGESWQGRALVALVLGSPERIARLEDVRAGLARLADPRGLSAAEAESLVAELPVVTALLHGIHGNEISSTGAAMATAYHLLAAQGDSAVTRILEGSLLLIDPVQNPDGRARFVQQNLQARGPWPDPDPVAAERDEPWPGGRSNHYLFDLNRDLFIQSQVESRARVAFLMQYWPHVVADLHEMSGNATYFFPPTAPPSNPWYGDQQIALMDDLGRAMAAAFDRRGFSYFNRDVYDFFYPGYMDGWPTAHGALGMTFEQASARGLSFRRTDGDLLTYGQGVLQHFTAALATAEAVAANRERILRDFLAFRREGVTLGERGFAEYVLHSAHDPGMAERLARVLVRNGIEVRRPTGPVTVSGRTLPERGTFIVPMTQPAHRFARNLLDPHVPMDEDFVARQIRLRAERRPDEIYDLTAWSQSLLWDVEAIASERATGAAGAPLEADAPPPAGSTALPAAVVGYLLPWGTSAAATVAEALREGVRVRAAGRAFTLSGRRYGVGTAIVRAAENDPDLAVRLGPIAARHGAEVVPIDDSFVEEGTSLGASSVRALREPRVLLVYGDPGSSLSVGWARYVLERRYGQRVSAVRAGSLTRARLSDFNVIVFPSGNYSGPVGTALQERLEAWVRDGGTLITMAESTRWAAGAGLLSTTAERRAGSGGGSDTPDPPIDYLQAIVPDDEAPEGVPGAILRAVVDTTHWLAAGTDGEMGVLVEGSRVFTPLTLDQGTNVGRYAELDRLVLSGVVWEESRPQLASKAFLVHQSMGQGQVIGFAEDPNYRAYTEATQLMFMNAVLLGPGR